MADRKLAVPRDPHTGQRLGWRDDPVIRDRMELVAKLSTQGVSSWEQLKMVNEWCRGRGFETISERTLYEDRTRIRELWAETLCTTRDDHIAALQRIKDEAMRAYHKTANTNMNRTGYLQVARGVEQDIAKLDGTYMKEQIEAGAATLRDLLVQVVGEDAEDDDA